MATQTNASTASHTDPFNRKYKILSKIGEGSYSEVLKCKNRDTGSAYACKRLKHCYRSWNQVNDIPEIVTLRKLARHPNILQMVEIHFDPTAGRVSLVFELMDMNLYELIKDRKRLLPESRVRVMMFQLMRALRHLHKHGIFHRDVKPENILLKNDLLKLGDLGSVRGLYSRPPYTEYISTRWYRSPECLLTCGYYSFKMDVWAAGCVFYEILTLRPLFPGSSELDQINRVHNVLGPPPQKILLKFTKHAEIERDYSRHTSKQARLDTIKRVLGEMKNANYDWYFTGKDPKGVDTLLPTHVTPEAKDLLKHLLQYDPDSRPSSHRALQHAYFKDLREQAQRAAREKMPSLTGPIVTIVGDEGGLEVTADDNANPVDLATLGDAKLKLKAPARRASEVKDAKESAVALKNMRKVSSPKVPIEILKPSLKEAGEMFSRETEELAEKKLHNGPPTFEPRRGGAEDRSKPVGRNLASLRFGGDATSASLPYQKVYLDEEEGDGPNTLSVAQLQERRKLSSNLNRRRGGSRLEVERKKSMTLMNNNNESSSGRGFSLDFIDKTSLTPDVMVRINENRRIAHMQPILSNELKNPRDEDQNSTFKDAVYTKDIKRHRSPLHSPNSFSPRDFQQRKRHSPRLPKLDTTSPYYSTKKELSHSNSDDRGELFSEARISKFEQHSATEKQVKELLASLPNKKKNSVKTKPIEKPKVNIESESMYNPGKNVPTLKNQLVKNIHALKNKYESEKKREYYQLPDPEESKKRDVPHRNARIPENLLPKGSFTNFSPRFMKPEPNITAAGRHLEKTRYQRKDSENNDHSPGDSGRHEIIRKIPNAQRDNHKDMKDRDKNHNYSDRHSEQRKDSFRTTERSSAELNHIAQRYERGIVHRHDLNRISEKAYMREQHRDHREPRRSEREPQDNKYVEGRERDRARKSPREQHVYEEQIKHIVDRNSRIPAMGHSPGQKSGGYLDNYESAGSMSPTNFRRLIENRRKTELVTTDTDADGDNNYNKARQPENGRRKRRGRYSNFSPSNSGRGQDPNSTRSFAYSPRNLLPAKYNQTEQPQPLASRLSAAGVSAAFKYSNTSSVANKQVREILAEMRKRRDILEDKVTKDTNLQTWNSRSEDTSTSKPTSQAIKKSTDIPRREDINERYLGFPYGTSNNKVNSKSPYHSNATKVMKPSGQVVASLSDFNTGRNRERIKNNIHDSHVNSKLGTGSGSMKYLDSEARLKSIGVAKTTEISNNSYQGQLGASSKAFPRNRYGGTVHKK